MSTCSFEKYNNTETHTVLGILPATKIFNVSRVLKCQSGRGLARSHRERFTGSTRALFGAIPETHTRRCLSFPTCACKALQPASPPWRRPTGVASCSRLSWLPASAATLHRTHTHTRTFPIAKDRTVTFCPRRISQGQSFFFFFLHDKRKRAMRWSKAPGTDPARTVAPSGVCSRGIPEKHLRGRNDKLYLKTKKRFCNALLGYKLTLSCK